MNEIINDVKKKLKIEIEKIIKFNDGTTESLVFCINEKYLIKTMKEEEIKNQVLFFKVYSNNNYFQNIVYVSNNYNYICFNFINGKRFQDTNFDSFKAINILYKITSSYKKINCDYYGYLDYKVNSSYDFLLSEINYAKEKIPSVDCLKVYNALSVIKKYKIEKYLLHGDFGIHNFIVSNNNLKVIDPMPLVFDPLYDFYFAALSSTFAFSNLDNLFIYYERDLEYKKNLFLIVFYIRMSRAFMYDNDHFNEYLKIYMEVL